MHGNTSNPDNLQIDAVGNFPCAIALHYKMDGDLDRDLTSPRDAAWYDAKPDLRWPQVTKPVELPTRWS